MLDPRVIHLNESVASITKMLRRLIGDDIQLVTRLAEDLELVKIDPSQIEQVIVNLVVNSRDAIGGVGTVTIYPPVFDGATLCQVSVVATPPKSGRVAAAVFGDAG